MYYICMMWIAQNACDYYFHREERNEYRYWDAAFWRFSEGYDVFSEAQRNAS